MRIPQTLLVLLIFQTISFAQLKSPGEQLAQTKGFTLALAESPEQATAYAKHDIVNGIPLLLVHSGPNPLIYPTDKEFEGTFGILYYETGCKGEKVNLAVEYNKVIFKHLTDHYGKRWKKKVREDVIGLDK